MSALVPEAAWVPARLGAPVFAPLAGAFAPLRGLRDWPRVDELTRLLPAAGVRFEAPSSQPRREGGLRLRADLYDARIVNEGVVPTRERSWHDLFNALVWATFPRAKAAVARRQHDALVARVPERFERLPDARTKEQDALALFDEGGGLVVVEPGAGPQASEALERGDDVAGLLVLFGHAAYEHALSTDAPLRVGAHVVEAHAGAQLTREGLAAADAALARMLDERMAPRAVGMGLSLSRFGSAREGRPPPGTGGTPSNAW